ncbi:MBL fold metallo-hydrolase [Brachyspira pilosicoli]|uniref:MBL fold metallo-hydrolase n=1 Tax=Brachyspira pilosicoli TaxID=52584 RepID=UPI002492A1B7|nr:MBL fold metallo-hydrolase [Brachyspira pilosicoli]
MINLLQKTFFIFFMLVFSVFAAEKTPMDYLNDNTPLKPTKVFDNVYCIGSVSVVAWVIETSDGLILIDSMWDDRDAKLIEEGIKGFGLDHKDLKYIILSHGHGDHYGGANYLRNKYAAKVVLTKTDTDLMYNLNTGANSPRSPKTKVDIYSKDKDVIKLGDTSITILETPGHTAG